MIILSALITMSGMTLMTTGLAEGILYILGAVALLGARILLIQVGLAIKRNPSGQLINKFQKTIPCRHRSVIIFIHIAMKYR